MWAPRFSLCLRVDVRQVGRAGDCASHVLCVGEVVFADGLRPVCLGEAAVVVVNENATQGMHYLEDGTELLRLILYVCVGRCTLIIKPGQLKKNNGTTFSSSFHQTS